jgi:iron complex outermembrane recepter protein
LQRVEVLRGPQSTLFGKNASAGVISIITQAPQYEFGGSAELSYGNFNALIAKADVTGPITDKIAFSLAGGINKRDGYATNLKTNTKINERNRWFTRGQLLIEPSESLKFRLIGDYDKIDEDCCFVGSVLARPLPSGAIAAAGGQINGGGVFSYKEFQNFNSQNNITNNGVSLQGDLELGSLNVTSISAYRESKAITNADSDFTSADLIGENRGDVRIKTKTQELRLASNFDGKFNFLLGAYYFNEDIKNKQQLTLGKDFRAFADALTDNPATDEFDPVYISLEPTIRALAGLPAATPSTQFGAAGQGRFEDWKYKNTAFSFFGTADFEIVNGLTLSGGFNYTNDKKKVASNTTVTDVFSQIDLVQVGANAGIPGVFPAGTFGPGQTSAVFPRITRCPAPAPVPAAPGTCNPFLPLQGLQFQRGFLNLPNAVESGKTNDSKWTYSVRLAWEATDNVNLYASYGTGFKATSWNIGYDSRPFPADFVAGSPAQGAPLTASPVRTAGLALNNLTSGTRYALPERATVAEIGIKARWQVAAFNLTFFKQVIKDFQGFPFSGTGFVLSNAGKQSTTGIEFDGSVRPTDGLQFTAAFTYLQPKYESFPNSAFVDATGKRIDFSGRQPAEIPELSTTLGVNYTAALSGGADLILSADYHYEAPVLVNDNPEFSAIKRVVNELNASAAVRLANGVQVTLWGRNLTKAQYLTTIFPSVIQDDTVFGRGNGSISGYPSQPRTYGVAVKLKF